MKSVVIVGGGFAGAFCAKNLEKFFDVILIDEKDYFEFTPGILRTLVEPDHIKKIQVMHNHYLKNAKFIRGHVEKISKDHVIVEKNKIKFDYLIIASGSRYEAPMKEQIITDMRQQSLRHHSKELEKASSVLIVGGGLVGVEFAGEIVGKYPGKKITLVHAQDRIIERQPLAAGKYTYDFLNKKGVEIILNEKVIESNENNFFTDKQTKLKADISFLCTGVKPNLDFLKECFPKFVGNKGLKVNEYLQFDGFGNIFSAGDVAGVDEEKTAQNAINHAKVIINNIKNLEAGKELIKYKSGKKIMIISLGKYNGIVSYGDKVIWTGFLAGLFKSLVEWREMLRYR